MKNIITKPLKFHYLKGESKVNNGLEFTGDFYIQLFNQLLKSNGKPIVFTISFTAKDCDLQNFNISILNFANSTIANDFQNIMFLIGQLENEDVFSEIKESIHETIYPTLKSHTPLHDMKFFFFPYLSL